ncbi:30S ribosomal protein S20 [Corynebacterium sp. Marseille-P4321]|uniref:30S ribosomal protein S20 n=1 Tax=Corynebacterium sp. Marseille-P4321 TaxID=2736603 RepID=UPI000893370E|nr:30S ribosomal protein S20 [Corynebacterium sp. Marseille-P4321]OEX92053.1 30S ribosomal protein S20 [Corynebacterium sp. BCW_4722]
MANIKQQKKRVLTNEKRRMRNKSVRSAARTEIRKFREAVESGDKAAAEAQLRVASRKLDKAVTKGVFHRNSAANKKSNMARALNKMEQSA